ncbi:hypothetical protein [Streptomyces sp. NPDC004435]|uniref:hypothetical protein n=1 Tax=Streptomyces sp. NPDC004435 TaxID=3364701 RepID=UPI0036B6B365
MDISGWVTVVGVILGMIFLAFKKATPVLREARKVVREYYNVKVEVEAGRRRALSQRAPLDE